MSQLHMFAQQLMHIPFLITDPCFLAFISVQGDKEFKQIVDSGIEKYIDISSGKNGLDLPNKGLDSWRSLVDQTNLDKVDAARMIGDYRRQLDVLKQQMEMIDREVRNTDRKAVILYKTMSSLSDQVAAWHRLESELADPLKNEYNNPHSGKNKAMTGFLTNGQSFWNHSTSLIPKILARVYLSGVQYQNVQVDGFRGYLQLRDSAMKDLEKAEKERIKAFEEKNKVMNSGQPVPSKRNSLSLFGPKGTEELETNCQKKVDAVQALQLTVDRMTKAAVYCEIDRFNQDRLQMMNQLLGSLAATNLEIAGNTNKKWTEIVANAGLNTEKFTECVELLHQALDEEDDAFSETV